MFILKPILVILFLLPAGSTLAQRYEYVYRNPADSSTNCYLKVIPETEEIRGLIIRDYSSLPDTTRRSPFRLTQLATDSNLMTVYTVSSGFFPELYYTDSCMYLLDGMIAEVVETHGIPTENIFIGGISASGTRALRYAQFCEQGKSKYGHRIKGVFSVDPPLDLLRFYNSAVNHKTNFKEGMLWEAELISRVFPETLGGSPDEVPDNYRLASVFSHNDTLGGNAKYLTDVHIILFHEPDIDWWITERGSSYYDINSFDIAAFVVALQSQGSNKVELVTTTGKGFDRQGNRKCHSWTIVDEDYLIQWILDRVE